MAPDEERPLTDMEERVARLVADGRTNADVAADLGLAEKTVEWHLARAARKLHVRSRTDLAAVVANRRTSAVQRKSKGV